MSSYSSIFIFLSAVDDVEVTRTDGRPILSKVRVRHAGATAVLNTTNRELLSFGRNEPVTFGT